MAEDGTIPIRIPNSDDTHKALIKTGTSKSLVNVVHAKDLLNLDTSKPSVTATFYIGDCCFEEECEIMTMESEHLFTLGRSFLRKHKHKIQNISKTEDRLVLIQKQE